MHSFDSTVIDIHFQLLTKLIDENKKNAHKLLGDSRLKNETKNEKSKQENNKNTAMIIYRN